MNDNLVDVIGDLISRIGTIQVSSIDLPTVYICGSTLSIRVGDVITSETGEEYTVTAVDPNVSIDVEPKDHTTPFAGPTVNMKPITFLHGTPQSTSEEYLELDTDTANKTPFAWLLETYEYDTGGRDSALAADFDVRMFLLHEADEEEWDNNQHNDLAIKPMEAVARKLEEIIEEDFNFTGFTGMNVKVRSRFGVYVTDKGNTAKIIEEDLSGVELRFRLKAYDVEACRC